MCGVAGNRESCRDSVCGIAWAGDYTGCASANGEVLTGQIGRQRAVTIINTPTGTQSTCVAR